MSGPERMMRKRLLGELRKVTQDSHYKGSQNAVGVWALIMQNIGNHWSVSREVEWLLPNPLQSQM